MTRRIELTIPLLLPTGNTWERMHWARRQRLKVSLATTLRVACWEAKVMAGPPMQRARVEVIRHSSKAPDGDNEVTSLKPLLDALRDYSESEKTNPKICRKVTRLGLFRDDSPDCIGKPVTRWVKAPRGKGQTTIIIEEV